MYTSRWTFAASMKAVTSISSTRYSNNNADNNNIIFEWYVLVVRYLDPHPKKGVFVKRQPRLVLSTGTIQNYFLYGTSTRRSRSTNYC